MGNELTPTQVQDEPSVSWYNEADVLYALMLVDPDVPSRTNRSLAEAVHWQVINIPGDDVTKGQPVFDYSGPAPSQNSGLHRYTFLVYKQTRFIESSQRVTARFDAQLPLSQKKNRKLLSINLCLLGI